MPNTPNGATKTEVEGGFIIEHPDGSTNFVGNADGARYHANSSLREESGNRHHNEQIQFSEEGGDRHTTYVLTFAEDGTLQHTGDHSRSRYEDGSTFMTHYNSNEQGTTSVDIIHVAGSQPIVFHSHIQSPDYFM